MTFDIIAEFIENAVDCNEPSFNRIQTFRIDFFFFREISGYKYL